MPGADRNRAGRRNDMSRSGYSDDCDGWELICWRGAVNSAIRGKRGQRTLHEILAALDAMPVKALAAESLVTADGQCCTLGVLGAQRGIALDELDPEDPDGVAQAFGIAPALAKEIVFENDEGGHWKELPDRRWERMRAWVVSNIKTPNA